MTGKMRFDNLCQFISELFLDTSRNRRDIINVLRRLVKCPFLCQTGTELEFVGHTNFTKRRRAYKILRKSIAHIKFHEKPLDI